MRRTQPALIGRDADLGRGGSVEDLGRSQSPVLARGICPMRGRCHRGSWNITFFVVGRGGGGSGGGGAYCPLLLLLLLLRFERVCSGVDRGVVGVEGVDATNDSLKARGQDKRSNVQPQENVVFEVVSYFCCFSRS